LSAGHRAQALGARREAVVLIAVGQGRDGVEVEVQVTVEDGAEA
jgi:hypothetical protein